ncbi:MULTISPECIES: acyl-CoA dehydrogenase [unclassified Niveibacterium]|uniref:acyl-CoA dehydrogenase n=1 Tax=unclassified Niveibacterium TaxID=2648924 RepID=UPI001557B802|nr:acyl-CoA dehydrogenase [Niveibacterium sp. COAC-50]
MFWLLVCLLPLMAIALAFGRAPLFAWLVAGVAWLAGMSQVAAWSVPATAASIGIYVVLLGIFVLPPLRRALITSPVFGLYRKILPAMSDTEKTALEAGTVWWDGELFAGRPNWKRLLEIPAAKLSAEEKAFVENETEELCRMVSDWDTTNLYNDLPPHVWQYIKDKGFLGMIIPKEYGGKGFSAIAHSEVVTKLATRSSASAVSVMVPNSLGPAELLLHYGTKEQKDYYLPRLAKGIEIPAFALTSPVAGSDAASIPDRGIICKGMYQGKEVLGMRVTWDKRYITLGPICTVLGLAFRLYDPDKLLGDVEDLGITCALVPNTHPGVNIGRRHQPLNAMFHNGPNWGNDVFMPLEFIIGGPKMAGQGWRMLMECLAAGRSISLPGSNTGMMKLTARAVGAYSRVRAQFKTSIGKFEGIEEPLARIGGNLYMCDAARTFTAGAIDLGEKPSVVSAIVKYHVTERARTVVNDGMDILGGKGICMGPQNFLARAYQQIPIGITVEGANILTRSLIIFGQGAIRCHPFVLKEMQAAQDTDVARGLKTFDGALFSHIGFTVSNAARALVYGLTGSHWVRTPDVAPETKRYYQQLTRFSAAFAFLADVSMLTMGGDLKRKEKLSARLGDILSQMYLCSATLKRYEQEGRQQADAPLMHWAIWDAMFKAQNAFEGVISNFPNRFLSMVLRRLIFPLGRPYVVPSDKLGHKVASLLIAPSETRDRLVAGSFVDRGNEEDPVGVLELALEATVKADAVEAKLRAAQKAGKLNARQPAELLAQAQATGVISREEAELLARRDVLRAKVIRVDDFPNDLGIGDAKSHIRPADKPVAQASLAAA